MSQNPSLQIPKKRKDVVLWVYPEGRVVGALFLSLQSRHSTRHAEEPLHLLNQPAPFVVVQCETPDELRFYNKASIVRVEYQDEHGLVSEEPAPLPCQLNLMDGTLIDAVLRQNCSLGHSRLYDALNTEGERFAQLYLEDATVCLVNKSYIVNGMGNHTSTDIVAADTGHVEQKQDGETFTLD